MKLWIIRHAKSSWGDPGLRDFDRPLNGRGKKDGPRMAAWLCEQSDPASWIWVSPAVRARATAEFVREGFGLDSNRLVTSDELYHATPEDLLGVLRQTPSEIGSVAVVAHNPGLTHLVNTLGSDQVTANLPTFGVARFRCESPWAALAAGTSTLELIASPKTID
jgi:phosphohistidine phosphatase